MACNKTAVLAMNAEEWSNHYGTLLDKKTDKSAGDDLAACWPFTGRVNKAGYAQWT